MVEVSCAECGKTFTSKKWRKQKYCGKECSNAALGRLRRKPKETRTCPICKEEFSAAPQSKKKFCQVGCATKAQNRKGRVTKACEYCGKEFTAPKSRQKRYCTRTCGNRAIAVKKRVDPVSLMCAICDAPFEVMPYEAKTRRFCSLDCANKNTGAENVKQTKVRPCVECACDVEVPRNAADDAVRCDEHKIIAVEPIAKECLECSRPFVVKRGRVKSQQFCSQTCAAQHIATQNGAVLKTTNCFKCQDPVVVPRSTADCKSFCDKCRSKNQKRARKRAYVSQKNRRVQETLQPIDQPAQAPYWGHHLLHLEFDPQDQHWFVVMYHKGTNQRKKVLLAKYILEAQVKRFLREDENIGWRDGDETNDSPSNIEIQQPEDVVLHLAGGF